MLEIRIKKECRKGIKLAERRGKRLEKLWEVVHRLQFGVPLEPRHCPHRLSGAWYPFMECHIEPDWLLVYHIDDGVLYLVRTGTHSDLFDM